MSIRHWASALIFTFLTFERLLSASYCDTQFLPTCDDEHRLLNRRRPPATALCTEALNCDSSPGCSSSSSSTRAQPQHIALFSLGLFINGFVVRHVCLIWPGTSGSDLRQPEGRHIKGHWFRLRAVTRRSLGWMGRENPTSEEETPKKGVQRNPVEWVWAHNMILADWLWPDQFWVVCQSSSSSVLFCRFTVFFSFSILKISVSNLV